MEFVCCNKILPLIRKSVGKLNNFFFTGDNFSILKIADIQNFEKQNWILLFLGLKLKTVRTNHNDGHKGS